MSCDEKQAMGGWWEDRLAGRCSFPVAPVNTWSNLAYVAAGVAVALDGFPAAYVEGGALVLLGVGSGLYHGLKTWQADRLDNAGMYLAYSGLMTYALAPHSPWTPWAMAAAGLLTAWRFAFMPVADNVEDVLMGCFVGSTALAVAANGHPWHALASAALMGAAYKIWNMDLARTFWWPRWGHGLWHVLTAAATYLLFTGR